MVLRRIPGNQGFNNGLTVAKWRQSGYSGQCGSEPASQDQAVRESHMIRPVGDICGSRSREPAGITATLRSGAMRGIGLPQRLQNTVLNRSASGTL
jgi:hypothetical protein